MSIEVRIPKEIKEYKEKIIFGLSLRQLASVTIGGIVCLGTYFLLKNVVGNNLASDIIIFEAIPIFAFGFVKIRSLNFEEFAKIFVRYKTRKNIRIYETETNLEQNSLEIYSKGGRIVEYKNDTIESSNTRTNRRNAKIKEIRRRIKVAKKEFKERTKEEQTREIDQTKQQVKVARQNYKRARKKQNI